MIDLPPFDRLQRRPPFLVPPFRAGFDPGADVLTLHTIQTSQAYERLRAEGRLVGDPTLADEHFAVAYRWMARQMAARLPTSGNGILWFWAIATRRHLVRAARPARGDVYLIARVDRERALVSGFSDWHMVLNGWFHVPRLPGESSREWLQREEAITTAFGARVEMHRCAPDAPWPDELRAELEGSWEAIFDAELWNGDPVPLQAAMHELRSSDITRAVRIR